jgi:uncharacterized membrane protein YphA (DoxX/SURF4 family)
LRAAVSMIALSEGASYLTGSANPAAGTWMAGSVAIACGASLLLGFLTPAGSAIAVLGCAGTLLSWFPSPAPNLIEGRLCGILVITVASAIVLLGPGAISIDARLFGRREIIIPRPSPRPPDL